MPTYPPRNEPVKKKEELSKRQQELKFAINNQLSTGKINKAAERYRIAQLSLLKAKIHAFRERQFQNKPPLYTLEDLEKEIQVWTNKSTEEIIKDFLAIIK